jgi:cytochrome c-type biogenesis protein CcmH
MNWALLLLSLCLIACSASANQDDLYTFQKVGDSQRYQTLIKEIRCVVCQGSNIADSNAPLATDLRNKVYEMVVAEQSDDDIKNYLVKRYGEFILYKPRMNKFTFVLWAFPFLALSLVVAYLVRLSITRARIHTN